jgi:PRTRC genetic system protein E
MGFFTALYPLLKRGSLAIRISDAGDGKVKLLILQEPPKDGEETVPLPPLRHVDTPEQLDQKLEHELADLAAYREGPVQSVLDQAKAQMDEAATEEKRKSAERLAAARKKPGATKPTSAGTKPVTASPEADECADEKVEGRDAAQEAGSPQSSQTDLFA